VNTNQSELPVNIHWKLPSGEGPKAGSIGVAVTIASPVGPRPLG
jgi:hypothetical protein